MGIYLAVSVLLIVGVLGILLLNDTLKRLKHIDEAPYPGKEAIKQPFRAPFYLKLKQFEMIQDGTQEHLKDQENESKERTYMSNTVTKEQVQRILDNSKIEIRTVLSKCTVVAAQLENGFIIVESSACVDPVNYDEN